MYNKFNLNNYEKLKIIYFRDGLKGVLNVIFFFLGFKFRLISDDQKKISFFSKYISSKSNNVVLDGPFKGTKLFSYSLGDGVNDPVLGFPLTYKNINNIGDIVFDFNITNDTFVYKSGPQVVNQVTNIGFLKKYNLNKVKFVNGWEISSVNNVQAAVRIYKNSSQTNKSEKMKKF